VGGGIILSPIDNEPYKVAFVRLLHVCDGEGGKRVIIMVTLANCEISLDIPGVIIL
jgi:hypothetical protein